jgi:hypothetical protein
MNPMNLVVALVAVVILFEPFIRAPVSRSMQFVARRNRARRAFAQAGLALIAALVVATSHPLPDQFPPRLMFGTALVLLMASVYWALRGRRLLRPHRMFSENH